ncbi:MAG: hypothetical protein U1E50_02165 [Caulobacteraceae bacterium]
MLNTKRNWLLSVALGLALMCTAARAAEPTIPATATTAEGFVPAGWVLDREATGDLDGDGLADLVLVVRDLDPANVRAKAPDTLGPDTFDMQRRVLIVALAGRAGGYRRVAVNSTLIPIRDEAVLADLLDDNAIVISGRRLTISLDRFEEAGSWNRSDYGFTFRWKRGGLELVHYDRLDSARGSGVLTGLQVDWLKRTAVASEGNVAVDDGEMTYRRIGRPLGPPPSLDAIGDGLAFNPDPRG